MMTATRSHYPFLNFNLYPAKMRVHVDIKKILIKGVIIVFGFFNLLLVKMCVHVDVEEATEVFHRKLRVGHIHSVHCDPDKKSFYSLLGS